MPRKNRREIDEAGAELGGSLGSVRPDWAQIDDAEVRIVHGQKPYRCPGCDHEIRAGVQHLVVVPIEDADERRHWHTECWRRELRRLGVSRD